VKRQIIGENKVQANSFGGSSIRTSTTSSRCYSRHPL